MSQILRQRGFLIGIGDTEAAADIQITNVDAMGF